MAQFGTSLSAVSVAGPGVAITPTAVFANASMAITGSAAAPGGAITAVPVALEVSWDGTNWMSAGMAYFGSAGGNSVHASGFPGAQLRANVLNWPPGYTGTVSAVVGGV